MATRELTSEETALKNEVFRQYNETMDALADDLARDSGGAFIDACTKASRAWVEAHEELRAAGIIGTLAGYRKRLETA